MADLIIRPKNDDHLKLQNDAGTTILELANDESKLRLAQNNISDSNGTTAITTSGANVTLAGTANNIGTVTSGTFNGTIGTSASGSANLPAVKTALNASGSAPIFACRAWVNFNGTGTVAIRDSGNVSSITDNGTGDYTVNFTTAMTDANYCIASINTAYQLGNGDYRWINFVKAVSTSSFTLQTNQVINGASVEDSDWVNHVVFA
jgi:hypothetical protein